MTVEQFTDMLNTVAPTLLDNLIYNTDTGWVLYEKYSITKKSGLYQVHRYSDDTRIYFSKLRVAATWAILDRYNKIIESNRVVDLDRILASINAEMQVHKRLQSRGKLENREINRDKYLVATDKQKSIQWELDKYIILAKICQDKGYQNELTRTARK